ncbi:YycH family regulatory protein [Microbacteriaceae bacterium 4G12]
MKIENFKTILLVNLIVISLFLTYNLWTYQPNSNISQNTKDIQDIPDAAKKDVANLVLPSRLIVHQENSKHLASEQISDINMVYKVIERGEFRDLRDKSNEYARNQSFLSLVHGKNKMEFVFSTEVPLDVMKSIFSIKEKETGSYSFDRMVIDLAESRDDNILTYFVSQDDKKVYQMTLKGLSLKEVENARDQFATNAREYFMYAVNESRTIFLPETSTSMQRTFYVTSELQEDVLKNTLFTDPRYVKQDKTEVGETYTDGTRLLSIPKTKQTLSYVNSSVIDNEHLTGTPLVQRSIDFINTHGGWTDSDRLYLINPRQGETVFRLYQESLPVFNGDGMATLKQKWGIDDLSTYKRPLFKLLLKKEDDTKVELPSGREIISFLENNPNANMKQIKDIQFGYEMESELGANSGKVSVVKLEPIWYITYENESKKIQWNMITGRGEIVGLE